MPANVGFGAVSLKPLYEKGEVFLEEPQVRAMVVESGAEKTVWMFADLYPIAFETSLYLRKRVARALRMDYDQVVLQSNENHYANLPYHLPQYSPRALGLAGDACEACAREALRSSRAAWMRVVVANVGSRYSMCRRKKVLPDLGVFTFWAGYRNNRGRADGTGLVRDALTCLCAEKPRLPYSAVEVPPERIRRDFEEITEPIIFDRPVDNLLHFLVFQDRGGKVLGTLTRFAAHVDQGEAGKVGCGYPHWIRTTVERALGGVAVFALGPQGDLLEFEKATGPGIGRTGGRALAREALRGLEEVSPRPEPLDRVVFRMGSVRVPLRKDMPATLEEAEVLAGPVEKALEAAAGESAPLREIKRLCESRMWAAVAERFFTRRWTSERLRQEAGSGRMKVDVPALALNDVVLAGITSEPGSQTTLRLRQQFGDRLLTLSEVNGEIFGYTMTGEDLLDGGYEGTYTALDQRGEAIIREATARMIARVLS